MAEEIDTPGDGQIKAMITIAGNPVLSAPDGNRLERALDGLEFMLSVDPYLNETTRHADVILPPPPPSQSPHFDFAIPLPGRVINVAPERTCLEFDLDEATARKLTVILASTVDAK